MGAGMYLGHAINPSNTDLDALSQTVANASANATTAIASAAAAATQAALAIQTGNRYHMRAYGGVGDGVTDDQPAYDLAYAAAKAAVAAGAPGAAVYFDAGTWNCRPYSYASGVGVLGAGSAVVLIRHRACTIRQVTDGTTTLGSNLVSSPTAAFTTADTGQAILIPTAGDLGGGESLVAIMQYVSATQVRLFDRDGTARTANKTIAGTADLRIGTPVITAEFNYTWQGNFCGKLERQFLVGVTIDANKANVSAPLGIAHDVTHHAVGFTNSDHIVAYDVRIKNAHYSGYGQFIKSNYALVSAISIENCGHADGYAGIDVNSSRRSGWTDIQVKNCYWGARFLDKVWGCTGDLRIYQCSYRGIVFNNQSANYSRNNVFRVLAQDCEDTGIQIATNWISNTFDLDASWCGGHFDDDALTFVPAASAVPGVLFGHPGIADANQPSGNAAVIRAFQNGGNGITLAAFNNLLSIVAQENSQHTALSWYGLEVNGSSNDIWIDCLDTTSKQRGVVCRVDALLAISPATEAKTNVVRLGKPNPTTPIDDQDGSNIVIFRRPGRRSNALSSGAFGGTIVGGTDVETQVFASTRTGQCSCALTGGFKGCQFTVLISGVGAFDFAVTDDIGGILATIPNNTAGFVDAEHDGTRFRLKRCGTIVAAGGLIYPVAVLTEASTTGLASRPLPHGAAPSSPVDGDVWTTTTGLFARINGVTVGPYT